MPKFSDLLGVLGSTFTIGTKSLAAGVRSLIFRSGAFTGTLSWSPTANRSIAFPNDSGTILLDDRPIGSLNSGVSIRGYRPIVAVPAAKTLTLSDANTTQICINNSTITIPLNASVAFPIGTEITIFRNTIWSATIALTAGVTVISSDGSSNSLATVYNSTLLKKTDTNTWLVIHSIQDSAFLPGDPTCKTQAAGTSNTTIANTEFVSSLISVSRDTILRAGSNAGLGGSSNLYGTAIGQAAALSTNGSAYVAVGSMAAASSTVGTGITALGAFALYELTTGDYNTAIGVNAGRGITTGSGNTIVGPITGLSPTLTNNVVLGTGDGGIKLQIDSNGQASAASFIASASTISTSTTTGSIRTTGVGIGGGRGTFSLATSYDDSAAASQINRSLYFVSGNVWAKRGDGSNVALSPLALAAPVAVSNVLTIPFDGVSTVLAQFNVTGAVAFTPATSRVRGAQTILVVSANGVNIPTLGAGVRLFTDSATYSNVSGTLHVYTFYEFSGTVWVRISR